jgi:hypothetical protein
MADTTCHMSISLDGFVAGPDQSREDPLGKRGRELHGWHLGDERANEADATAEHRLLRPRGASGIASYDLPTAPRRPTSRDQSAWLYTAEHRTVGFISSALERSASSS